MSVNRIAIVAAGCVVLTGCDAEKRQQLESSVEADDTQMSQPDFWDPIPSSSSTKAPDKIHDEYWNGQFERVNKEVAEAENVQLVFFGDSITKAWTLLKGHGREAWEEHFAKYNPINMGNSGDITPVMLYRASRGNLDFPQGEAPQVAVLLCGTNNYVVKQSDGGKVKWDLGMDTPPGEVADGVRAIAQAFRRELPGTRVIVLGILPVENAEKWKKCEETNQILAGYRYPQDAVVFMDLQEHFMNADGSLKEGLFTDGTHLTPEGYAVMADAILPQIERLMELGPVLSKD